MNNYVNVIKGQPLIDIGRAADMAWICFGDIIKVKNYKGEYVEKSSFALHLQCPWRMVDTVNKKILFTAYDMYLPNSSTEWTEDFDWDIQGINRYDEQAKKWFGDNKNIIVEEIELDELGDLKIILSNHYNIEVFVNKSNETECWRFFEPGKDKEHFVMTGKGYSFQ